MTDQNAGSTSVVTTIVTSVLTTIAGLVLVAIGALVLQPNGAPSEIWVTLVLGGAAMAGAGNSITTLRKRKSGDTSDEGGHIKVPVLLIVLGFVGFGLTLALASCASAERNGGTLEGRVFDLKDHPAPMCGYEFKLDGERILYGTLDICPDVPLLRECPDTTPERDQ